MVKTYEIVKEDLDDNFAGNYKEWYKQLTPEDKLEIDGSIFLQDYGMNGVLIEQKNKRKKQGQDKIMILRLIWLCLLMSYFVLSKGQKVYLVKYKHEADKLVYITKYKHEADLKVFVTKYKHESTPWSGIWCWVSKYEADWKIQFCKHKHEADIKIYFVKYKHEAGT